MQPFLPLGPLAIPSKPLLYVLGTWLALLMLERVGDRYGYDGDRLTSAATYALLGAAVAARLAFVIRYWQAFAGNWLSIVWPLTSGYLPAAGLLTWILLFVRLSPSYDLRVADLLIPSLLILFVTVALGDLFGGPGFGVAGESLPGGQHPVQLYEALIAVPAWLIWRRAIADNAPAGVPFLLVTTVVAFWLLIVTPWRGSALLINGFYVRQLVALLVTLVAVAALALGSRRASA